MTERNVLVLPLMGWFRHPDLNKGEGYSTNRAVCCRSNAVVPIYPGVHIDNKNEGESELRKKFVFLSVAAYSLVAVFQPNSAAAQAVKEESTTANNSAQDGSPAPASDTGDIIVTAQKRAENVQNVPISIAAFDEAALVKANVTSPQDIGRLAPNFQATRATTVAGFRINIRGVGGFGNSAIEPSAATFLDGIYIPRAGSIISTFLDIEDVEVLRGPQGTIFGRNASVGALSLHSAAPKSDLSARVTGEYGTGDRYKLDGYINVPLTDNVAFRVAALGQSFGGYWHNNFDGKQYGGADTYAVRASLKATLGNLEWIVRGDYNKMDGDGVADVDFDPRSVTPAQLANLRTKIGGQLPDTNLTDRNFNQYVDVGLRDRQWGLSSQATLDLNGGVTLRLIDSYRDWHSYQKDADTTNLPADVLERTSDFKSKSQNHELQLISPQRKWLGGHLDLVSGLYYFEEDYNTVEGLGFGPSYCPLIFGANPAALAGCSAVQQGLNSSPGTIALFHQHVQSLAAYAQPTFHLTDTVSLSVGGRYTHDRKTGNYNQSVAAGGLPFFGILRAPEILTLPEISEGKFTYRVSLNYKPTRDVLLFANYSTGYKSGGYNSSGAAPSLSTFDPQGNLVVTRRTFGQETTTNYELGAKTSWLNHKLRANITFYRMDIDGYQDRSFDGTAFIVRNAGKLRQQGFEFDSTMSPTRRFSVTAALAYLDSKFLSFPAASGLPGLGGTQNLAGARATFSPKWTGNVGVNWNGDLGSSGMSWGLNGNISFISDESVLAATDNNPQGIVDGYAELGARITLNGKNKNWSLSVFGNNLTNENASDLAIYQVLDGPLGLRNGIFPGSSGIRFARGVPRTFGVSATKWF